MSEVLDFSQVPDPEECPQIPGLLLQGLRERLKKDGHHEWEQMKRELYKKGHLEAGAMWVIADVFYRGQYKSVLPEGASGGGRAGGVVRAQVGDFDGRTAPIPETVEWVSRHIGMEGVEPGMAPSAEAWGLLGWVKLASGNEEKFWTQIWPKLMPSKKELDEMAGLDDDGLAEVELVDRIKRGLKG